MRKILLTLLAITGWNAIEAQGFGASAIQWNIPISTDSYDYQVSETRHAVIDMNGDKIPDFIDTENQSTESIYEVFLNGSQKYWKVYLGSATGFSATATQWNIPISTDSYDYQIAETRHTVMDMNGDGLPDFVDTENESPESTYEVFLNGSQKYWKVYLNTGTGFSATATQWNIPISTDSYDYQIAETRHTVMDMDGDGKPDFVDTENQATESTYEVFLNGSQKYWKVYLNTGTGFSATATQWNIPISTDSYDYQIAETRHTVMDMDGDGKPDFVDTENQATESVYEVFLNGSQKYWKVYLNNGTGFSATATQWNIPISTDSYDYQIAETRHTVLDMNGDKKPDFVDTENQATESVYEVFLNGSQKYWKVYFNTGTGFSATATQWNIPISTDSYDYQIAETRHTVMDMNGDNNPDFLDTENEATESIYEVFLNGNQKYWKVYLNNSPNLGNSLFEYAVNTITVYPNPVKAAFQVAHAGNLSTMKIYDTKGSVVKEITSDFDNIDISGLPQGIYLLKVANIEGQIFTRRLVKE